MTAYTLLTIFAFTLHTIITALTPSTAGSGPASLEAHGDTKTSRSAVIYVSAYKFSSCDCGFSAPRLHPYRSDFGHARQRNV